jgi:hypothetical protein
MKQREHAILDKFAALNKPSKSQAGKLPKHADQATCVLAFFAIAARERISEKNPAFRLISINGPVT